MRTMFVPEAATSLHPGSIGFNQNVCPSAATAAVT